MFQGLLLILDPLVLLAIAAGVVLGLVVGAIPGFTATMTIVVLLPVSFFLPIHVGIPFLIAILKGANFGGAVPAILIATPGTGSGAATVEDGYPLSQQGKSRKAIEISLYGSVIGDLAGDVVSIVLVSVLAVALLAIGPPEMVLVIAFAVILVSVTLAEGGAHKGLLATGLGIVLGLIGMDSIVGTPRLTWGMIDLVPGINIITVIVGLYAITEILRQGWRHVRLQDPLKTEGPRLTWAEFMFCLPTIWRSTVTGIVIGILPGVGNIAAAFTAYAREKQRAGPTGNFGRGDLRGVAAPETANNAVNGPTMIPLLSFGIPGDSITAILLAGFIVHGMAVGPRLMQTHAVEVYAIFWGFVIANIILLVIGAFSARWLSKLARVSTGRLLAATGMFAFVATYVTGLSAFDLIVMLVIGALGFIMVQNSVPRQPLVLSFLLFPIFERSIIQAMSIGPGPRVFVERPVSLVLLIALLVTVAWSIVRAVRRRNVPDYVSEDFE